MWGSPGQVWSGLLFWVWHWILCWDQGDLFGFPNGFGGGYSVIRPPCFIFGLADFIENNGLFVSFRLA